MEIHLVLPLVFMVIDIKFIEEISFQFPGLQSIKKIAIFNLLWREIGQLFFNKLLIKAYQNKKRQTVNSCLLPITKNLGHYCYAGDATRTVQKIGFLIISELSKKTKKQKELGPAKLSRTCVIRGFCPITDFFLGQTRFHCIRIRPSWQGRL